MEGTISEIRLWAPTWSPRNWFSCSGQLLSISQFTAFFSLIGTLYGGDGRTSFGVPDLRGRTAVGYGAGPGLTPRNAGQAGGLENVTLNVLQIPSHNHGAATSNPTVAAVSATIRANGGTSDSQDPTSRYPGLNQAAPSYASSATGAMASDAVSINSITFNPIQTTIGNTGGSQSHHNMQPWLSVGYIICFQGIFPSRN